MNDYLNLWFKIIETMNNDNTYKLAWGKALIEIITENTYHSYEIKIHFEEIAYKMLKYYWNQLFFFNLKQSSGKKPVIIQLTEKCIDKYITLEKSNIPKWFDYAVVVLKKEKVFYEKMITAIARHLKEDVSWRFLRSGGIELSLYQLDKSGMTVTFTHAQAIELRKYASVLAQLLNFRWAELLERFNNSPRIVSKVKGISEAKIKRNSLKKFKDVLVAHMPDGIVRDFYTGKELLDKDISVDHVIPWSFMYSDDIWNLVITSKRNNSKKYNHVPSDEDISRLKQRNDQLVKVIKNTKMKEELLAANAENYVSKFYISLKL